MRKSYKRLINNTIIFAVSEFASKILIFLMLPLYTSYMTTGDYGTSDLINTTIALVMPVLTLSISSAVLRFIMENSTDKNVVYSIGLKINLAGIVILVFFYPILSYYHVFGSNLTYFYLMYIFNTADVFFNHVAKAVNKIKLIGITGILKTVIIVSFNILFLVMLKLGVAGYLLSYIIAFACSAFILWLGTKNSICFRMKMKNVKLSSQMLLFSVPLIPNNISWWLVTSVSKYIINSAAGAAQLGLYSVASRIPAMITTVQNVFISALSLSVIEEYENSGKEIYFSQLYKLYSSILIISCSVVIALTKPLANFLFSNDFYEGWRYVPLLTLSTYFGGLAGYLGCFYSASKKTMGMFVSTLVGGIITLVVSALTIQKWGVIGVTAGSVAAYFMIWLYRIIDTYKYSGLVVNFFSDIMSGLIIMIQIIIIYKVDNIFMYPINLVLFLIVSYLNRALLQTGAQMAIIFVKSRGKGNNSD